MENVNGSSPWLLPVVSTITGILGSLVGVWVQLRTTAMSARKSDTEAAIALNKLAMESAGQSLGWKDAENARLAAFVERLEKEIEAERIARRRDKDEMSGKIIALEVENTTIQASLKTVQDENEALRIENVALKKENGILKEKVSQLENWKQQIEESNGISPLPGGKDA